MASLSTVPLRTSDLIGPPPDVPGDAAPSPDWALLDRTARLSDRRNASTAECHTPEGQPVAVSFWPADPPGLSHLTVHCPGLDASDFYEDTPPVVLCAEGPLVLLRVTLNFPEWRSPHLFVYSAAGNGDKKPSLHLVPCPDPEVDDIGGQPPVQDFEGKAQQLGLLPCGDGGRYAVALPHHERDESHGRTRQCYVYIFSSEKKAWTRRKAAPLHLSESDQALFDRHGYSSCKQVAVGRSSVGWVDLVCGILLARNLFNKRPIVKFIPFPASRARITDEYNNPYYTPEYFCDVVCSGDLIKFVEIDFADPDCRTTGKSWRATTWCRRVCWDDWRRPCTVDVDDVSVDQSYSALLPELLDEETQEPELRNLEFLIPTLGVHDDDLLYMLARGGGGTGDGTAWVVAVDMRRAVMEALVPVSTEMGYTVTMYCPCAFPKYLDGDIIMALGASMEAETAADNTADTNISTSNQNFSDEEDSDYQGDRFSDYWCAESLEGYALPFYGEEGGQVFSDEEGSDQGNGIGTWCGQSYYGEARYGYCEEDGGGGGDMGNPMDNADVFGELPQYVSDPDPDPRANRRKEKKKMRRRKKKENRRRSKEQEQEQEQKHHPLLQLVRFLDDRPELHPICFVACVLIAIVVREFLGTNPWQAG
ncbi:uncharacterized protein [Triticum aestivum]|uniref:uncharacterized protein n=1 Tax=Triticum aestivum TaxID=4565 RepID=UPI001D00E920|nr:uncharacterized protein LOC123073912 [Triticum aestivum]